MRLKQLLPGILASALATAAPFGAEAFAREEGAVVASWYGSRHQGLRTSNGDVFDQERMTAASASLPLGSRVRVTMRDTGQSVIVLINDRMGVRGARIDLSRGAARQIGLLERGRGVVMVAATEDAAVEVAEASDDEVSGVEPGQYRSAPSHRQSARRGSGRHRRHMTAELRHLAS